MQLNIVWFADEGKNARAWLLHIRTLHAAKNNTNTTAARV